MLGHTGMWRNLIQCIDVHLNMGIENILIAHRRNNLLLLKGNVSPCNSIAFVRIYREGRRKMGCWFMSLLSQIQKEFGGILGTLATPMLNPPHPVKHSGQLLKEVKGFA